MLGEFSEIQPMQNINYSTRKPILLISLLRSISLKICYATQYVSVIDICCMSPGSPSVDDGDEASGGQRLSMGQAEGVGGFLQPNHCQYIPRCWWGYAKGGADEIPVCGYGKSHSGDTNARG